MPTIKIAAGAAATDVTASAVLIALAAACSALPLGAAWGDPEIVLVCGVDEPEGFDQFSACEEADGVGWYVPEEQAFDPSADLVMTTIGIEPRVELRIPGPYRPPAGILVEVAPAIKEHLRVFRPCV